MDDAKQELRNLTSALKNEILSDIRAGRAHAQVVSLPAVASLTTEKNIPTMGTLEDIRAHIGDCTRCKLHRGRNQLVFGIGDPHADLMIVGEAPGRDEDLKGEPFVGRAGQLLTGMIESIGITRADVYIANVIKCRPPENRNPEPDEIESCEPFLKAQIATVKPKLICALGKFATQTLLRTETPISKLRGQWATYEGIPMMPTYHPAYLLRNPAAKKEVWEDLKLVHAELCQKTGKAFKRKGN